MPRFGFLSKLLTLASNLSNTFLAVIEPYSVSTKSKTSFNCLEASNDHSISILVPLVRTSSTPRFTQLCHDEKIAVLGAMF